MRILFTAFPATAHVHPLVPLAWALQNAGHEVRVAIHPDTVHLVTEAGLPAVPLGSRETLADAAKWNDNFEMLSQLSDALFLDTDNAPQWERQWQGLCGMLGTFTPMLDDLVEFCRGWQPDLVVWDPFCVAAGVAARVTGAAHARFLWGQDNIAWLRAKSLEAGAGQAGTPDPVDALMAPMLERYGLEYSEDLLLGQFTVDTMPRALQLPLAPHYAPIRRVSYNGNTVAPAWVHQQPEKPRVLLTLGMGGRGRQLFDAAGTSFPEVVDALAELDVEVVATLHKAMLDTVTSVPDNVRLTEYVPLAQVLPSCSAVIHHGGGGTFAAAAAAAVPQLIVPMSLWGEAITARFMEDRGAGVVVEAEDLDTGLLTKQIRRLLEEPEFRAGAQALRAEINQAPGPAEFVSVLETLTAQHRP
ncbi:nucleotide disphospho-sugar-binding domain-containing protein [Streptomyces sp. NPDC050145]|uniref:nucleotide disphospho-sugar-binding domain-containing protein n=1 Tax=Streptomyces sp. NPDC050145 TaxID=3365602 RepID=UPI00378D5CDC